VKRHLSDAIREALNRDQAAKARQTEFLGLRSRLARLTARQYQIMTLIVAGKLNKQIAPELGLSQNTVKVHRRHIMEQCVPSASPSWYIWSSGSG
jgi:FixJ family two-component response regulator